MRELREQLSATNTPVVISGCVGPRGDGNIPDPIPSKDEAQAYHAVQIGVFAKSDADMVTALTMTNANEAIGVTRAAQAASMPVVRIHFGDGWAPPDGATAQGSNRGGRCGDRQLAGLLS